MRLLAVRLQNLNSLSGVHEVRFEEGGVERGGGVSQHGADGRGEIDAAGCDDANLRPRAGGSKDISRWCNHRKHADTHPSAAAP